MRARVIVGLLVAAYAGVVIAVAVATAQPEPVGCAVVGGQVQTRTAATTFPTVERCP